MKKLTRKIAALLTAAVVALTAVILPDTGGLIPKLLTSASADTTYTVTFDAAGGSPTPAAQSGPNGTKIIKPAQDPVKKGYTFEGWYVKKLYLGQEGNKIVSYLYFEELGENSTISGSTLVCAKWSGTAVKTSFRDADGTMKTVEAVPLDGHERILDSGWYVVDRDLSFSKTLYITGDAKIILADGKTMYYGTESAPMTGESIGYCINVLSGSLNFYTQSEGTGGMYVNMATKSTSDAGIFASENTVLNFNGGKYNFRVNGSSARGISAWNINITDGTFRFSDSYTGISTKNLNISGGDLYIRTHFQGSTAAISASDITVSGGKLDVASAYGINTGTITITGGVFKVNGAMYSGGGIWASGDIKILGGQYSDTQSPWSLVSRGAVYLSYQNPDDFIEITQYNTGQGSGRKVNFLKPFYLDGTTTLAVANNHDDYNIRWKKLVPKTQTVTVVAKDTENNDVKSAAAGKKTVVYGGKAELTAPDVDGYVFRGWYNGDTLLSSDYEYTTDEIKQDTTIKALYELISATGASSLFGPLKNGLYTLESKTYTLTEDIYTLGRIYVPNGVNAVIDLNGFTIDRGLNQFKEGGGVVGVAAGASLTVKNGTIKGGARGKGNGGGFNVNGSLTLDSVIIENCKAEDAGGGIYINGEDSFVLLEGNCIIRNNTAGTYGGGIYVGEGALLAIEGKPVVKDNSKTNVYLIEGRKINVSGVLSAGTQVGVTHTDEGKTSFTRGYRDNYNSLTPSDYFFADNGGNIVLDTKEVHFAVEYVNRSWNSAKKKVEEETLYVTEYIPFSKVKVSGDNTVDLTNNQWYVVTEDTLLSHQVRVFIGANIILCDGKKLICDNGLVVENNNTLCIYGQKNDTGRLVSIGSNNSSGIGCDHDNTEDTAGIIKIYGGDIRATGDNAATGIGGGYKIDNGTIEIYGGTVTANGGYLAAGIGIGRGSNVLGNISIMGGTVNAVGGTDGAGIGGGASSPIKSGKITIKGGTVNATGRGTGAGIGSGYNSDAKFDLTISGGTVKAVSSPEESVSSSTSIYGGAGIGTGGDTYNDFNGTITITGGKVDAYGSGSSAGGSAGIGTAISGNMNGTITITGGEVTAIGCNGAAAIGAGTKGRGAIGSLYGGKVNGTISILGGTVKAKNNTDEDFPSAYIGHGYDKGYEFDGTLILGDNMKVQLRNSDDTNGVDVLSIERITTCRLEHTSALTLCIMPCDHPGSTYVPDPKDDSNHIKSCAYCKHSETEPHQPDSTGKCILCGYSMELTRVARVEPTCTEPGNVEYYTDPNGNYYMEAPEKPGSFINVTARMTDLAPLGHDLVSTIVGETAASCESAGHYTVRETCTRCTYVNETVIDVPALGHDYTPETYTWNDDYTECIARKVCRNDASHVVSESGTVTFVVNKQATVDEEGQITYTAKFTKPGFTTQTLTVATAKLVPGYGDPVYTWAADYSWCKGVRTSVNGAPELTETTTLIHIAGTVPATCTGEGMTKYVAEFENEYFTDQTKTVTIPKLTTHTPGTAVTEVASAATCTESGIEYDTVYCTVCSALISRTMRAVSPLGHTRGEPVIESETAATCTTDGSYDEVVTCTVRNAEISRDTIVVKAFGHDWCEPTYTWAADNSTVTAMRVCAHDNTHIETETVNTEESVLTKPTKNRNGVKLYTATFENKAFTKQQKKVDIPANGYDQLTFELEYETVVYDGTEKQPKVTVKDADGKTVSGSEYIVTYSDNVNAGTASVKIEDSHGGNHVFETAVLKFTITKADVTISLEKTAYSKTYGDPDFVIDGCSACFNAPVTLAVKSGEKVISLNNRTVSILWTGSAVITASVAATGNYNAASADISVTVAKAKSPAGSDNITLNVDNTYDKVGRIQVPAGWAWTEPELELPVGEPVITTAVYSGADAECYENTTITATITRADHTHTQGAARRENVVEATCTEGGSYDEITLCARCGAVLSNVHRTTDPLGHIWGAVEYSWAPDNSTCTASRTCERDSSHTESETVGTTCVVLEQPTDRVSCTKLYTAVFTNSAFSKQTMTVVIPSYEHIHTPGETVRENVIEPTCTEDGSYDEVVRCTVCGEIISTVHRVTESLGHNFVNGVCTRCGATDPNYDREVYVIPEYIPSGTGSSVTQPQNSTASIKIDIENVVTGKKYSTSFEIGSDVYNALTAFPADGSTKKPQSITLDLGKANAGLYANLYRRDPKTGKLTLAACAVIDSNGSVNLKFAYPPKYTIIIDDHSHLISAVPTATGMRLSWEPVKGAQSYAVYVKKNGSYKKLKTTSKTSFSLAAMKNGRTYEFMVRYKVAGKLSEIADSYTISFTAAYRPIVTARSANGSISLSWNAVAGAEKYKVCKYVDGKLRTLLEVDGTAVKITGTKAGKTYTFAVKALVNGKWTKVYSGDLVSVTAK